MHALPCITSQLGEASDHQEPMVADPAAVLSLELCLLTAEPSLSDTLTKFNAF